MKTNSQQNFGSTRLQPLEFRVWRTLTQFPELSGAKLLFACSGGADSIAGLEVLARLQLRLGFSLEVAAVHHGTSPSPMIVSARAQALTCAKNASKRLGLSFHVCARQTDLEPLVSEASLRAFRHQALRELAISAKARFVVFAHHSDDLFETRLIRLIRGTGAQGLKAMSLCKGEVLRPFLAESRKALREYATRNELEWCEDPTNAESTPLRNWLRSQWLPALEIKRPGSSMSLARSLEQLANSRDIAPESLPTTIHADHAEETGTSFSRESFLELEKAERSSRIAALLLSLGARDFTQAHVEEILKRLISKRTKEFNLLSFHWLIKAGQVTVSKVRGHTA